MSAKFLMGNPPSKEFMTACSVSGSNPCIQIPADASIEDAVRLMAVADIHHLLVIGPDGNVCGTLSSNDILKALA